MPSHLIASSPARCRVVRPPGNLDRGSRSHYDSLSVLQHRNYKMDLVSCANEQDLQHIVPGRFWNGLSLPTDVEVSWSQEEEQWDHRPWIGWSHSLPSHSSHHSSRADNSSRGTSNRKKSVASCRLPNSITATCWQQVGRKLATSASTGN